MGAEAGGARMDDDDRERGDDLTESVGERKVWQY